MTAKTDARDKILNDYMEAYNAVHDEYPNLIRSGSWYYINDFGGTAYRLSEFPEFTRRLARRLIEPREK